jgi:hypothetical protein
MLEDRLAPAVYNVNTLLDPSIAGGVNTATGVINGTANTVSLRSAIQAANATAAGASNTINLTLAGTYKITLAGTLGETDNLKGEFSIYATTPNNDLTIQNTSGSTAIVDGGGLNNRVFDINANAINIPADAHTVTMIGFTIQNGLAADPANPDGVTSTGAGIRAQGNQSLTLNTMVITANNATADGGGVAMANATSPIVNYTYNLTITNSTISFNHAGDAGGGIDTDGGTSSSNVTITGSLITGNTDQHQGAGVYIDALEQVPGVFQGAPMTMTNTIVSNNSAIGAGITASGGGISNAGNGLMTLANCTISANFSGGQGGGFSDENNQGSLAVTNSYFLDNSATMDGGAIQEGGPSITITNTEIKGNSSGGSAVAGGGGIFISNTNTTIDLNTTVTITASTIVANTATGNGAGIEFDNVGTGNATITNTTIFGNTALNAFNPVSLGGGIDASPAFTGSLKLLNDTINGNFAPDGGGFFWAGTGTVNVQNTIIAFNNANAAPDVSINEAFMAVLSGTNEVPPNSSTATGAIGILFNPDLKLITIAGVAMGLEGTLNTADLHVGAAGSNGPVANDASGSPIDFTDGQAGTTDPVFPLQNFTVDNSTVHNPSPGFITDLMTGKIYADLFTTAFPGPTSGEIRGQFSAVPAGTFIDNGGNLIGVSGLLSGNGTTTFTAPNTQKGSIGTPLNPRLGVLRNNGGPTVGAIGASLTLETEALLVGSPAINNGIFGGTPPVPTVDERGFPRPDFGIGELPDVGAFELQDQSRFIAVATGFGGAEVRVFNAITTAMAFDFFPFGAFSGGVRVAVGDVNGDGIADIITATGPGSSEIKVFSGKDGTLLRDFFAGFSFNPTFMGGIFVAAGDVNGDGFADIAVSADVGGLPEVKVFSGKDGSALYDFFAYNPLYLGGVKVALGDVTGDGLADIVTVANFVIAQRVSIFAGNTGIKVQDYFVFGMNPLGVSLAVGDVNGDGHADVILGTGGMSGLSATTEVRVLDGVTQAVLHDFMSYSFNAAVRVGSVVLNAAGYADIVTVPGSGSSSEVKVFDGMSLAAIDDFFAFAPNPALQDGFNTSGG